MSVRKHRGFCGKVGIAIGIAFMLTGCASADYLRTNKSVASESDCEDIRIEFAVTEKNRKRAGNVLHDADSSIINRMMFWETLRAQQIIKNAKARKHELAVLYQQKGC